MQRNSFFKTALLLFFFFFASFSFVYSYEIEEVDVFDENRFELGPTMFQIVAKSGETLHKELQLTNRSGEEQRYKIFVKDFVGSDNPLQFTTILEESKSSYGASNWFIPEFEEIYLEHGERVFFDLEINIPDYADAGEHYAIVIVEPDDYGEYESNGSLVRTRSRVGSLFLIDIEGQRIKSAELSSFTTDSNFYEKTPVSFNIDVENTGNVHVSPSGRIVIKNIWGKEVEELEVSEFIVLRESLRRNSVDWNKTFAMGRYEAELFLDLGLGSVEQGYVVQFWIIPWKFILGIFMGLVALIFLARFVLSKIKIEVKLQ